MTTTGDIFLTWYEVLEKRHLADLTFQEVRRAVQALSTVYVQKRDSHVGEALGTAGKRAAFAMFYAPLHFLTIREIVRQVGAGLEHEKRIVDLGCGTGVAGAAWALEAGRHSEDARRKPEIVGVEKNTWAGNEARWTFRKLGLRGKVQSADLGRASLPGRGSGIVAAFTMNELDPDQRDAIKARLLKAASEGASILIVEPIARRLTPWWDEWAAAFETPAGRSDEWRIQADLPDSLRLMDKAAHLDHRELTARSIWRPGGGRRGC
jgi:hypothetical protein